MQTKAWWKLNWLDNTIYSTFRGLPCLPVWVHLYPCVMSIVEHDRSTRFLFYYCSMTLWHSRFSLFLSHTLTYTHTLCPAILQEQVRKKKPPEAVCYRQAWNCAKPTVLARAEELYEAVFINYKFPCGLVAVRDGTAKQKKIKQSKKIALHLNIHIYCYLRRVCKLCQTYSTCIHYANKGSNKFIQETL